MAGAVLNRASVLAASHALSRRAQGLGSAEQTEAALFDFLCLSGAGEIFLERQYGFRTSNRKFCQKAARELSRVTGPDAGRLAYEVAYTAGLAATERLAAERGAGSFGLE